MYFCVVIGESYKSFETRNGIDGDFRRIEGSKPKACQSRFESHVTAESAATCWWNEETRRGGRSLHWVSI